MTIISRTAVLRPHLVSHVVLRGGSTTGPAMSALADHSGKASQLFGNMRMPAAFLASLILSLTFGMKLPSSKNEKNDRRYALLNTFVGTISLLSELNAIVQASVAVNKLTETLPAPAASVLALLQRDYQLAWLGTNVHFMTGLFGAALMVGLRAILAIGPVWGFAPAAATVSVVLTLLSTVNDGIASGDGRGSDGIRFGRHFGIVFIRYIHLLVQRALGDGGRPLQCAAIVLALVAMASALRNALITHEPA